MTQTIFKLLETKLTALEIFTHTGISPDWQHRFASGKIPDPSVNRIEHLYLCLCAAEECDPTFDFMFGENAGAALENANEIAMAARGQVK